MKNILNLRSKWFFIGLFVFISLGGIILYAYDSHLNNLYKNIEQKMEEIDLLYQSIYAQSQLQEKQSSPYYHDKIESSSLNTNSNRATIKKVDIMDDPFEGHRIDLNQHIPKLLELQEIVSSIPYEDISQKRLGGKKHIHEVKDRLEHIYNELSFVENALKTPISKTEIKMA